MKRVTNNYEGYEISNCGHWVAEEEPELISDYIIKFFNKK
ncbi:MAG: alpha/beta hydrolase [Alphaproteobacteria bacterium TMED54]|nr:MAG: alpha/beta hydrolase [Alphaproteobacteria bacterium TMED54]